MTLLSALAALQGHAETVASMKYAPDLPTKNSAVYPFAMAYPAVGDFGDIGGTAIKGIHIIYWELHYSPSITPLSVQLAATHIPLLAAALRNDPTLGGAVTTILLESGNKLRYTFGFLEWGGLKSVGTRFEVPVKIIG